MVPRPKGKASPIKPEKPMKTRTNEQVITESILSLVGIMLEQGIDLKPLQARITDRILNHYQGPWKSTKPASPKARRAARQFLRDQTKLVWIREGRGQYPGTVNHIDEQTGLVHVSYKTKEGTLRRVIRRANFLAPMIDPNKPDAL